MQDSWRLKGIGILRIIFGVIWGIDAWFKWQPDFINNFSHYLSNAQAQEGQPTIVKAWIGFWVNTVNVDPHVFAHFVAVAETLIAIALIFGVFRRGLQALKSYAGEAKCSASGCPALQLSFQSGERVGHVGSHISMVWQGHSIPGLEGLQRRP